jgi:hypothetical protein
MPLPHPNAAVSPCCILSVFLQPDARGFTLLLLRPCASLRILPSSRNLHPLPHPAASAASPVTLHLLPQPAASSQSHASSAPVLSLLHPLRLPPLMHAASLYCCCVLARPCASSRILPSSRNLHLLPHPAASFPPPVTWQLLPHSAASSLSSTTLLLLSFSVASSPSSPQLAAVSSC